MSKSCIDCDQRYPGCHSKCKAYTEYNQQMEKARKSRQEQFDYKDYISNRLWREKRI